MNVHAESDRMEPVRRTRKARFKSVLASEGVGCGSSSLWGLDRTGKLRAGLGWWSQR